MALKKFKKMAGAEFLVFCLMAISSGMIIGIGGASSLLANSLFGVAGKLIGACMFSLGIYAIVVFEMRLFTGMIADIPTLGVKNFWQLPVCFIFNVIGVAVSSFFVYYSYIGETVVSQAIHLISGKLHAENWWIQAFCSSVLCGALISISVKANKYAPLKNVSSTLGVIFPIVVFAFCGFDHSVANMMYFFYLGECSWQVFGYVVLNFFGNIVGGVFLPTITLLKERVKRQETVTAHLHVSSDNEKSA
jgi:formate/nitrite transporter FocA (FNT family)